MNDGLHKQDFPVNDIIIIMKKLVQFIMTTACRFFFIASEIA